MSDAIEVSNERLAIHGGRAVFEDGPPAWPIADEDVRLALESAYLDGTWGRYHGPHCDRLEAMLAEMHGARHVLLCSSGTVAVEIALRGLRIGPGDEVILAGYDFPGNFRNIETVGARPVVVDIDPGTWCLDHRLLEEAIAERTRAIVVSHLHGGIAAMKAIRDIAGRRGLAVIEDACQAPGASIAGRMAGRWGDVSVFSFGGSKLLTAGRGGAVMTNDDEIFQRAKIFCERGNHAFPLSELQAAVLRPQLEKLPDRNATRHANVQRLRSACRHLEALVPLDQQEVDDLPSYYKLAWRYDAALCANHSREDLIAAFQAEGVAFDAGFRGFARRSERRCRRVGKLTHSQNAAAHTLLLHHPVLLAEPPTIDRLGKAIEKVVTKLAAF